MAVRMKLICRFPHRLRDYALGVVWAQTWQGAGEFEAYKELLEQAAVLLPRRCKAIFPADRGCADTALMAHLQRLGWHWRMRIKRSFWLYRPGRRRCKVERLSVARGHACFWQQVSITENRYGPVSLAVTHAWPGQDVWSVLSDEPTDGKTFEEYGLRIDISYNSLYYKSNGFPLEVVHSM
jgi:hypothetical protein